MIAGVAAIVGAVVGIVGAVYIVPRMRDASRDSSDQTLNVDTNTVSYPDNMGSPKGIEMMATVSTTSEHPASLRTSSANIDYDSGKPTESAAVEMIAGAVEEALKAEEATQTGKPTANPDVEAAGASKANENSTAAVGMVHDVVAKAFEQQLAHEEKHGMDKLRSAQVDVKMEAIQPVVSKELDTQAPALPSSPTTANASVPSSPIGHASMHKLSSSSIDAQRACVIVSAVDEENDDSTL